MQTCPSCGGALPRHSRFAMYFVCPTCRATVVQSDEGLRLHGKMAELPADMSPMQVGTTGYYQGKTFTLLGRLRVAWDDGFWNEWYAMMDDGREAWLGEAMGFLMFSFPVKGERYPPRHDINFGRTYSLPDRKVYTVFDMREVECVGSEGELPFVAEIGRKSYAVDLTDGERGFANLDYGPDGIFCYVGEYLNYDDFRFSNVRTFDDW